MLLQKQGDLLSGMALALPRGASLRSRHKEIPHLAWLDLWGYGHRGEVLTPLESAQVEIQAINVVDTWRWEYREYRAGRLHLEDMNLAAWRGQWEQDVWIRDFMERSTQTDTDFIEFFQEAAAPR